MRFPTHATVHLICESLLFVAGESSHGYVFINVVGVTGKFESFQGTDNRDKVFWAEEVNIHVRLYLLQQLGNLA